MKRILNLVEPLNELIKKAIFRKMTQMNRQKRISLVSHLSHFSRRMKECDYCFTHHGSKFELFHSLLCSITSRFPCIVIASSNRLNVKY